jgi:hypothetical protein
MDNSIMNKKCEMWLLLKCKLMSGMALRAAKRNQPGKQN